MDDSIDLLDRRGRLRRLVIAASIGLVLATLAMRFLYSDSTPSGDSISQMSFIVVGLGVFLAATSIALSLLTRLARRLTPA